MQFSIPLPIQKPESVWETYVPIVQSGSTYDTYLTDTIADPAEYSQLCHLLLHASDGFSINIHLNTPGGNVDSAFMLIDAIKKSDAVVTAYCYGTVASAGTIIALSCDDLVIAPYTQFMIHNYSTGTQGKGHEVMSYINFNDAELKEAFADIYLGFLTEDEMNTIIKGEDKWMGAKEVEQRWATIHESQHS